MRPRVMDKLECELFDSIVHSLRTRGWSRIEAEGEALNRIERTRTPAKHEAK